MSRYIQYPSFEISLCFLFMLFSVIFSRVFYCFCVFCCVLLLYFLFMPLCFVFVMLFLFIFVSYFCLSFL